MQDGAWVSGAPRQTTIAVVAVLVAAAVLACAGPARRTPQVTTSAPVPTTTMQQPSRQTLLPFRMDRPSGAAVDAAGNVYVVDGANDHVLKLAPP